MKKKIAVTVLCLILSVPVMSFADVYDYSAYDLEWDDCSGKEGRIYGTWTAGEDKTAYRVELYKAGKLLVKKTVNDTRADFSESIVLKAGGAGKYTFKVIPVKGGEPAESEILKITSVMVTKLKKVQEAESRAKIVANGAGWVAGPAGIWLYYDKNGYQLKKQWVTDKGYKYYLDEDGRMVTGWQKIGKAWYFFETAANANRPKGACYVDCVTPDGYTVNGEGAWFEPADTNGNSSVKLPVGKIQPTKNSLSFITVRLKEDSTPGAYSRISSITSVNGTVSNIVYQTDPSTWTSGVAGTVVFDVTLNDSLLLSDSTKVACSRAAGVKILSADGQTAHIELQYVPKFKLSTPCGFYLTGDRVLKWIPVQNAESYTVKAVFLEYDYESGRTTRRTETWNVPDPAFPLEENGIFEDTELKSLTVQALGSSKKVFQDSSSASVGNLTVLAAEKTVEGDLKYSTSGMTYRNEDGQLVKGWQQIGGSWYYFKVDGYAAGPGWYQAPDGNWFYFDNAYRMQIGHITDNGKEYFLNDGSNKAFPKGAWVH